MKLTNVTVAAALLLSAAAAPHLSRADSSSCAVSSAPDPLTACGHALYDSVMEVFKRPNMQDLKVDYEVEKANGVTELSFAEWIHQKYPNSAVRPDRSIASTNAHAAQPQFTSPDPFKKHFDDRRAFGEKVMNACLDKGGDTRDCMLEVNKKLEAFDKGK